MTTSSDVGALHRLCEQVDDLVIAPEVGEVFERKVDGAGHRSVAAQVAELVELPLLNGHAATIHPAADAPLHFG